MERQSDDESSKSENLCKDIEGAAGNTVIEDIGSQVELIGANGGMINHDSIEITSEDSSEITSEDEPLETELIKDWPEEKQHRFATEIVVSVHIIRKALNEESERFPFPKEKGRDFFSVPMEWKRKMWSYIRSQSENFKSLITRSLAESSNPDIFENCKNAFIDTYKPDKNSETGIVSFSAAIAFLGIHLRDEGLDRYAHIKAKDYIYSLTTGHRSSSERDTLSDSSG